MFTYLFLILPNLGVTLVPLIDFNVYTGDHPEPTLAHLLCYLISSMHLSIPQAVPSTANFTQNVHPKYIGGC